MIDIMSRRPIKNQDYIISRKVSKHIIGQALYQCLIILVLFFNGEYLIPESNSKHEWPQNPGFVQPGRASDLNSSVIYSDKMASEIGPSRHLTFVFTAFVFMQVCNMIASRAIFDEINIFQQIALNWTFVGICASICCGQFLITQYGGHLFVCCLDGLTREQWLLATCVGLSTLAVNFVLKFIPDGLCPSIGNFSAANSIGK
jgi:Ca2+ transporting ATPase